MPIEEFPGTERFEVRRRLGAGGMGVVYEAYDRQQDRPVALKTLQQVDASALYRFKREFRALADVVHPNLVRLHELFAEGDRWFFTMELLDGESLLRRLEGAIVRPSWGRSAEAAEASTEDDPRWAPPASPGNLEPTEAFSRSIDRRPRPAADADDEASGHTRIYADPGPIAPPTADWGVVRATFRQLAEALIALHAAGQLHRDVKSSNVMVCRDGRVVLLDFGLATESRGHTELLTASGQIVGTLAYMSPEQATGKALTTASDWYSVGVILYRALTGRLPFSGRPIDLIVAKQSRDPAPAGSLVDGIPEDLDRLCLDLLAREPERRPTGPEVLRRLGDPAADEQLPAAVAAPDRPVFVGRDAQLDDLERAYEEVRGGKVVAALVHGRSGAGKSSLAGRFLDALLDRREAVVLAGRCYERESVAYKAFDALIDALTRYLRRLTRLEAEALLPRDVGALARVFPVLRRVDAVADAPQRSLEGVDRQDLRRRAFEALRDLLGRIGDRRPLVLAIDDLQWGDLDSAALLVDLLRPPDPPPLLLIGCYRSEQAETSPCLVRLLDPAEGLPAHVDCRPIPVGALTFEEAKGLALRLLGEEAEGPLDEVAEVVARESRGLPYFVAELVEYLRVGGGSGSSRDVTLDDVLWRRVGRLTEEARHLLEVLAVAGRPIRQAVACRAAECGPEGQSALATLRADRLIRSTGPGDLDDVETYHDRVRETVVARIGREATARWHGRLAEALAQDGRADAEELAVHYDGAGDAGQAWGCYARAAAQAAEALAFDRAAALYRRALELRLAAGDCDGPGCHALRVSLADALASAGRGVESAAAYREAAAEVGGDEALTLQRNAAYQLLISGRVDEGIAALRPLLHRIGMRLPRTPGRAMLGSLASRLRLIVRGLSFRRRSAAEVPAEQLLRVDLCHACALGLSNVDWVRGAAFQSRALLLALEAGEPLRVALSLGWETVISGCSGRIERWRTPGLERAAAALAEEVGHPHAKGMALLGAGGSGFLIGRLRQGLDACDRGAALLRRECPGAFWERDTCEIFAFWCLHYMGHVAELRGRVARLGQEARERGDRYMEATLGYPGVLVLLADDRPDEARALNERVVRLWSQQGFHVQHLTSYYSRLYIALYEGDGSAAWRVVAETRTALMASWLTGIEQVRIDELQLRGRAALAAAAGADDPSPLLRVAGRMARRLAGMGVPQARAYAWMLRAGLAARRGDDRAEAEELRRAVAACEVGELDLCAAASRIALGRLVGGDEGRALVEVGRSWMLDQTIVDPSRMAACVLPAIRPEPANY